MSDRSTTLPFLLGMLLAVQGCTIAPTIPPLDPQRPVFSRLPARDRVVFTTWLNQDCRVDSTGIEADMAAGPLMEEALLEALRLGPTQEAREELGGALAERYALRQRWLVQRGQDAVVSPAAALPLPLRLLEQSEEQFRAAETAKLDVRWRDAALAGLGLNCTSRSLEVIQGAANDSRNPSAPAARASLARSRNCSRQ